MLTGSWRNFDHLEENLSYPELISMIKALRSKEEREWKMLAAANGIDLGQEKNAEEQEDPVERAKRRARARMTGENEETLKYREQYADAGFEFIEE